MYDISWCRSCLYFPDLLPSSLELASKRELWGFRPPIISLRPLQHCPKLNSVWVRACLPCDCSSGISPPATLQPILALNSLLCRHFGTTTSLLLLPLFLPYNHSSGFYTLYSIFTLAKGSIFASQILVITILCLANIFPPISKSSEHSCGDKTDLSNFMIRTIMFPCW